MRNDMPSEIAGILDSMMPLLGHIDLLLFDRGFYSKDLIMKLNNLEMNYLIFVPKDPQVKEEFTHMCQSEKKILLHEFYAYRNGRRVNGSVHLAFLKQIFDHRTDAYYDWCFATNVPGSGRVPHKDEEQGHSCEIFPLCIRAACRINLVYFLS